MTPRRAVAHVVVGVALATAVGGFLAVMVILWGAAVLSLAEGPTGPPHLPVLYVVTAVAGPVPFAWAVIELGRVQRGRFGQVLGVAIDEPTAPTWGPLLLRPWRTGTFWRHLAYHLVAPVLALVSVVLVLGGRAGLSTAVRLDTMAGRALLGPGRADRLAWEADRLAREAHDLARRVEELGRSRAEIIAATDAERRRIERDLHDGAQQRLVHLAMNLGLARESLVDIPAPASRVIAQAHEEAIQALTELRGFIRGLHPAVMNDRGLDAALSGIVATAPIPVTLRVDVEPRCSPTIEAIAYFTVSEALTNVAKHADATRAVVEVRRLGERVRVVVTDDGRGGATVDGQTSVGTGLNGLRQRAAAVEGTLTVHSPPGGPTTLTVDLPCGTGEAE